MRVNFNVLNQKGAPALYEDSLANIPPASFAGRLFVDTDQPTSTGIYRDTGTGWQLISSVGGGGFNIYNSDGTLISNRVLNGASNDLTFADLNVFKSSVGGNDIGLILDFANDNYTLGDPGSFTGAKYFTIDNLNGIIATGDNVGVNGFKLDLNNGINQFGFISTSNSTQIYIDDTSQLIKTTLSGNDIGLKLDFANQIYDFGDINNSILNLNVGNGILDFTAFAISIFNANAQTATISLGDYLYNINGTSFYVDYNNGIIGTKYQSNDIGLKLDFANGVYFIGDTNFANATNVLIDDTLRSINVDALNDIVIGDCVGNQNSTKFIINDTNKIIKTQYGFDIGLKLDFANSIYQLGQITLANTTYLTINDSAELLLLYNKGLNNGLNFDFATNVYQIGYLSGINTTSLVFDGPNTLIQTKLGLTNKGISIDFVANAYLFGELNLGSYIRFDFGAFGTYYNNNVQGLNFNLSNNFYYIGQDFGTANDKSLQLEFRTNFNKIRTIYNNNVTGLSIDYDNEIYKLGRLVGGNTTYFTIDDAATYPVQIDGTNILSGTSGGNSGQHLKIRLNGVDYKIKLENP